VEGETEVDGVGPGKMAQYATGVRRWRGGKVALARRAGSRAGIDACPLSTSGFECPVKNTAEVIEGRWTTLVIRELLPAKNRFSEIQWAITGISPKVLTTRLRLLERRRLLTRTVFATVQPTTEYELTPLGRQLEAVLNAMADFGKHLPGGSVR